MNDQLSIAEQANRALANDGTLNVDDLRELLRLVNADGIVTDEEREALRNLFSQLTPKMVTPDVWTWIRQIRSIHSI